MFKNNYFPLTRLFVKKINTREKQILLIKQHAVSEIVAYPAKQNVDFNSAIRSPQKGYLCINECVYACMYVNLMRLIQTEVLCGKKAHKAKSRYSLKEQENQLTESFIDGIPNHMGMVVLRPSVWIPNILNCDKKSYSSKQIIEIMHVKYFL
jgi:hypothetical protein